MIPQESRPGSEYYEDPYIPSMEERKDWKTWPLRPVEAHHLLVTNVEKLSETDHQALRAIIDGDYHPDQEVDMFLIQRGLLLADGYDDEDC